MSLTKASMALLALISAPVVTLAAPHTTHQVSAATGEWQGRMVVTSANQAGYFTDIAGNQKLGPLVDFRLEAKRPYQFGFAFDLPGTDFNVSYVVTLVKQPTVMAPLFASPTCQFNVSAKGPANPDVRVESYNGAKCHFTITGHGEDFYVG